MNFRNDFFFYIKRKYIKLYTKKKHLPTAQAKFNFKSLLVT